MKIQLPKALLTNLRLFLGQGGRRRQAKFQPGQFHDPQARLVFWAFAAGFTLISARAVVIHLFPSRSDNLTQIADHQYTQHLELAPYRGAIYDRRKEPLAISTRMPSLFVNPRIFAPTESEIASLANILHIPASQITALTQKRSYFSWLLRKIPTESAERAMSYEIRGLYMVVEPTRFYPAGNAASNLLGMVGMDDTGLMGLERQFEKQLRGDAIKITETKDARGHSIFMQSANAAPEKPGNSIHLTIDRAIQEIAEEALAEGAKKALAKGAFAIVSDPHTGRILALANYPTFNPNNVQKVDMKATKNKALTDTFEPGSVMKSFVVAEALERHKTRPDSLYNAEGGHYEAGGVRFSDAHPPPKQMLTTTEVLVHSSNVCTYKIADSMGMEAVYNAYLKFGYGTDISSLGFPGESRGYLSNWQSWKPIRFANIAFGQGIAVNGLELVQAYGAIANGGNLMKPYYISKIESPDGSIVNSYSSQTLRRVMSPESAKSMRDMLRAVVDDGVKAASLDQYTAGGKTGTAQKVEPGAKSYSKTKRIASFAGLAPIKDPHLVIYVVVDEPGRTPYYGALWAAPVFKKIAERSLRYLNVAPDKQPPDPTKVGIMNVAKRPENDALHAD